MPNKKHPNTGNQHAAKPAAEKLSTDKIIFSAPAGTKSRIIKASQGKPISAFLRDAVAEKLEREGF